MGIENRILVAVTPDEQWAVLAWAGDDISRETSDVDPALSHIEFETGVPYGLNVLDFRLRYTAHSSPSEPDDCDVYAYNVVARRPTPEEIAALLTDGPEQIRALWRDIGEED